MKVHIEYQDQFGRWLHYQTKYNEADAFRIASRRAASTNKRHRIRDDGGSLIDIIE